MGITPIKFVRKPLFVDAVRVTNNNFDDVVGWCQGTVEEDESSKKRFIRVRVHNPKSVRQSKAFVGDWILYTDRGYKVYTNKAFHASFDKAKPASKEELEQAFPPKGQGKPKPQADRRSQAEREKQEKILARREESEVQVSNLDDEVKAQMTPALQEQVGPDLTTELDDLHEQSINYNPIPASEAPAVHEGDKAEAIAAGREVFPTDTGPDPQEYPETHTIGGTPREEINVGAPEELMSPAQARIEQGLPEEADLSGIGIPAGHGITEVVDATPENIAAAVAENELVLETELDPAHQAALDKIREEQVTNATVEVPVDSTVTSHVSESDTAPPATPSSTGETVEVPVDEATAEQLAAASEEARTFSPRILSRAEQDEMGPDAVRELLKSGGVMLAQDVDPTL